MLLQPILLKIIIFIIKIPFLLEIWSWWDQYISHSLIVPWPMSRISIEKKQRYFSIGLVFNIKLPLPSFIMAAWLENDYITFVPRQVETYRPCFFYFYFFTVRFFLLLIRHTLANADKLTSLSFRHAPTLATNQQRIFHKLENRVIKTMSHQKSPTFLIVSTVVLRILGCSFALVTFQSVPRTLKAPYSPAEKCVINFWTIVTKNWKTVDCIDVTLPTVDFSLLKEKHLCSV